MLQTAILVLVFGSAATETQALQVSGLYSHELAVADESEAERSRAFSEALAAVVVKLTGAEDALRLGGVNDALRRAGDFVEGISYSSNGETRQDSAQRTITINFSPALIDDLLERLGVPVWNSNRPSVLVWIAIQNAQGQRRLLNPEADQEITSILEQFARSRGLPLIFPVLDFEDRRSLADGALWDLDAEAIALASRRYGPDSILAGRIHFTPSDELVGLWQFHFQGEVELFDGLDEDLSAYLESPLQRVTGQLADYFALPSLLTIEQQIGLRVDGIRDLSDYAALLGYVQNLGIVEGLTLAELDAERLDLSLRVLGDRQRLIELIALDRDLIPVDAAASGEQDSRLIHYRWTR